MRVLHLGIAADYLVMAETLVHLKSLELLPRAPTSRVADGPAEDPRERLVRRLVEHERFRAAAAELDALPRVGRDVFTREPASIGDAPRRVSAGIDVFGLLDLYHRVLLRKSAVAPVHEVGGAGLDLATVVRRALARLGGEGRETTLAALLHGVEGLAERVLTFLALLEMARLRWVTVDQDEHLGPVRIVAHVDADADVDALMGRGFA
jgi:segregation and condensation protein A